MPRDIRGILIDMDGTLVDHLQTIARCFEYATRRLGFPVPGYELVKRSIGGSMPVTMAKFVPEESLDEAKALWSRRFEEIHLEGVELLHGYRALLDLRERGRLKAAVFTNKTGRHTRAILQNEGIADRFDFVLGAEDTPYRKPQPEFSRRALEMLGLPAGAVAMIGDSPFDIEAAKCVGMASLCVTTGSHTREELLAAGADIVRESLAEIADWLNPPAPRAEED